MARNSTSENNNEAHAQDFESPEKTRAMSADEIQQAFEDATEVLEDAEAVEEAEDVTVALDEEQAAEAAEEEFAEDATVELSEEEAAVEAQLAEDAEEALDSLYEDEDANYEEEDERLTQLLTPIHQTANPVTPLVQGPTESVASTMHRNEGRIRHGAAAAIISILVLFGIGLGAGMYVNHVKSEQETAALLAENERRAAEAREAQQRAEEEAEATRISEASHALRPVKFIVSASEYDSRATRIPLLITGIDLDGNEVQTEAFIDQEGEGAALMPGEYTAIIPVSPILANGGLYKVPTETYTFRVPNNEAEIISVDQAIVLIPINVGEYNDDIINNAYNWALKDAQLASVGEANAAAARKIYSEEKSRKAAEDKRRQAEEQRVPLAQMFAENFFTNVGFPDSEDDSKVKVITNWNAVVNQYVASGSSAASKLGAGNGARYSYATSVQATAISGDTITVEVDYVSADEITNGWTLEESSATLACTFNNDNKITDFTVS